MYIGGGADATKHLIANGLVCLLEWPEALEAVVAGCNIDLVVEEDVDNVSHGHAPCPVAAVEDIEISDQVIRAGQRTSSG